MLFDELMNKLGYDPSDKSTDITQATGIGNVAAQAVLDFRHNDASNQLGNLSASGVPYSDYTGYMALNTPDTINDVNHWQPLRVSNGNGGFVIQSFVGAQWRLVTPFALKSASQFRPLVRPPITPSDRLSGSSGRALWMPQSSAEAKRRFVSGI